jgi:ribosomal protein L12E/L44/L45/RPP1/RPP2
LLETVIVVLAITLLIVASPTLICAVLKLTLAPIFIPEEALAVVTNALLVDIDVELITLLVVVLLAMVNVDELITALTVALPTFTWVVLRLTLAPTFIPEEAFAVITNALLVDIDVELITLLVVVLLASVNVDELIAELTVELPVVIAVEVITALTVALPTFIWVVLKLTLAPTLISLEAFAVVTNALLVDIDVEVITELTVALPTLT